MQPTLHKVELHCHLLGVVSPALLTRIRHQGGTVLVEPDSLATAYPITGLETFRRWVELLKPYQTDALEAMRPVLAAHVADLISQHVVYAEIMISPTMLTSEPRTLVSACHRWREWAFALEDGRIQLEFLMVVPRALDSDRLERDTATFVALKKEGLIVGVALVGLETGESLARFASSFRRWREVGLGIEIHAGEHGGPESVWDALEHGQPARLGHGISAFQDPALLEHIRRNNVHLELCPTSNIRTGAVKDIQLHPVRCARDQALSFSLNTDDPGAFECSLQGEYQLVQDVFGFTFDDLTSVFHNSLAARFQPRLRYLPSPSPATMSK
jgi:aminodeoxyfutalosine deaminase